MTTNIQPAHTNIPSGNRNLYPRAVRRIGRTMMTPQEAVTAVTLSMAARYGNDEAWKNRTRADDAQVGVGS